MAPGPATRRDVGILVAAVLVVALVGTLVSLVVGRSWLPGVDDCTVEVGGRSVGLSTDEAERAAAAAARGVRRGWSMPRVTPAVADATGASSADARLAALALTGRARHALVCDHGGSSEESPDRLDASGLTRRAAVVRRAVDDAFGRQAVGGFAPGGVSSGHMPGSAHYEGRAVDVFYRPVGPAQKTRGWATAQWLVAQADRYAIDTVIFDGRIWTARRAGQGWRDYAPDVAGRPRSVALVLEHRDHVHVDVAD